MDKALIATVEYSHDCILSDVPERYPDTEVKYLAELGVHNNRISHMFDIKGDSLNKFLEGLQKHHTTYSLKTLAKNNDYAQIITETKEDVSTHHALTQSGCFFISTPTYNQGLENAHLFAPSFSSLKLFIDSLNGFNVKIKSKKYLTERRDLLTEGMKRSGYLDLLSASELLTAKQSRAFKIACSLGYYEMPRKCSLEDIALKFGISDQAAGELLRKAEKKIYPALANFLEQSN
jgi:predicted DNA binding protein